MKAWKFWSLAVAALSQACTLAPENDGGIRTTSTPLVFSGYWPGQQLTSATLQQKDQSGNWSAASALSLSNGSDLLPQLPLSDGTWYPWKVKASLRSDQAYWTPSPFGAIVQTRARLMSGSAVLQAPKDMVLGRECASQYLGQGGMAVIQQCATQQEIIVNTCARGGLAQDCGPADYPTAGHKEIIAALAGKTQIDDPQLGSTKLTGRFTEPQRAFVRNYLQSKLTALGLSPSLDTFTSGSISGANVLAWLDKTTGTSNEVVVVGAHFDSVKEFASGALDNAAGVAMVLDVVKHLSLLPTRNRKVLVALFDEEEPFPGMYGSAHLADALSALQSAGLLKVHSVHLVDEIGDAGPTVLIEAPSAYAAESDCMWNLYQSTNTSTQLGVSVARSTDTSGSDYIPMLRKGFHAINITEAVGGITGYHKECLNGKACGGACQGNCAAGVLCPASYCDAHPGACACDAYENLEPEYLAAASLLYRAAVERVVTHATTACD